MNLNPVCERCFKKMVWIGIGPGAEPVCPKDCAPILPGTRCPYCKSFALKEWTSSVGWGFANTIEHCNCIDCGRVFERSKAL